MRGYLDAAAIRDMLQAGITIGSHGMHHIDWRRANDAELDDEITGAKRLLETVCAQQIYYAGIPFGSYDRRVIKKLRKEDWRAVYTSDGGLVQRGRWMKARNTLDHRFCNINIIGELTRRDTFFNRLRRKTSGFYKQLR